MKMVAFEVPIYGTSSVVKININTENTGGQPDYSSMYAEIERVKMPVSFAKLKEFYNMV